MRLGDRRHDLFGDQPGVFRLIDFRQQDQELVAAVAADRIRLAHAGRQAARHRAQHLVADGVAERVVDVLEPIAIEEQHREPPAVAARQRDRSREAVVQQQPVRQIGQRIVLGEVQHLQPALARDDDVAEHDHGAEDVAVAVVNRRRRMLDGGFLAVAADQDVVALEADLAVVLDRQLRRILRVLAGQAVGDVEHFGQRPREGFGARPAGQRFRFGIEIGDVALGIGGHHRVADRVQRDFGALALDEHLLLEAAALEHHRNQLPERAGVDLIGDDKVVGAAIDRAPGQRLVGRARQDHDRRGRGRRAEAHQSRTGRGTPAATGRAAPPATSCLASRSSPSPATTRDRPGACRASPRARLARAGGRRPPLRSAVRWVRRGRTGRVRLQPVVQSASSVIMRSNFVAVDVAVARSTTRAANVQLMTTKVPLFGGLCSRAVIRPTLLQRTGTPNVGNPFAV